MVRVRDGEKSRLSSAVLSFGWGGYYQLGLGDRDNRSSPHEVIFEDKSSEYSEDISSHEEGDEETACKLQKLEPKEEGLACTPEASPIVVDMSAGTWHSLFLTGI